MSVFGFLRPKFKHPDPVVRGAAIAKLSDQAQLTEIALTDENVELAVAALQRVTDEELRSTIARSSSPLNMSALEGIGDPSLLAAIAQHAESGMVRARAAARIVDPRVLHKIAAHDPDPLVRLQARARLGDAGRLQQHLRTLLLRLEPAVTVPAGDAGFSGGLDEVCAALTHDGRFQIDAVVAEPPPSERPAVDGTGSAPSSPAAAVDSVVLLAHRRHDPAERPLESVTHYEIRIRRRGGNVYEWWMTERRAELTHDVESWASSSRG